MEFHGKEEASVRKFYSIDHLATLNNYNDLEYLWEMFPVEYQAMTPNG